MKKQSRAANGITPVRVHNPAGARFMLGLPGERRKNVAKTAARKANRKRKTTTRRRRRNTSSVRSSTALAPYKAASPARRANPRRRSRRRGRRRNPASRSLIRRVNPFGGKFFGLSVQDLLGGAVGYVGDELISLMAAGFFGINPVGGVGLVVRGVGVIAMGKYLPKSLGPAAVIVSGAKVIVSVDDAYLGARRRVLGFAGGFIPAAAAANGTNGGYTTG